MRTEVVSCFERATAQAYGVAGSPVDPTMTIGGASGAETGPGTRTGGTGQKAQSIPLYASSGPKRGAMRAHSRASASYAAGSRGAGKSRHVTARLASMRFEYPPSEFRPLNGSERARSREPSPCSAVHRARERYFHEPRSYIAPAIA